MSSFFLGCALGQIIFAGFLFWRKQCAGGFVCTCLAVGFALIAIAYAKG